MEPRGSNPPQRVEEISADTARRLRRRRGSLMKTAAVLIGLAIVASLAYGLLARPGQEDDTEDIPTAAVERGDLIMTVSQRGSIWAMKPLEIRNEVEGWNDILELVDEGTHITEQDVEDEMVLVRLDSSGLEEREANRQIDFYEADAACTQAQENHEIQQKQNESDIALAELNVRFGRMELERYLGKPLAAQVLAEQIDFAALAEDDRLGGTARQTLRELQSEVLLSTAALANRDDRLQWTQKLYDKGYVGRNDLSRDQLERERIAIGEQEAKEELRLFKLYALPKEAEQLYSGANGQGGGPGYREAVRSLERVQARAQSRMAQAEANLKSTQAQFKLEQERLAKIQEMIVKSVIRASRPGLVIYGSSGQELYRQRYRVEEGASVPENAVLIRIPDPSDLAVKMNVPEAKIDKIKVGQPALITMEAAPGETFLGRVARISPMANPAHAWLNPDAKVYETEVALEEAPKRFIPGMSATAEIVVAQLKGVVYVPTQAVVTHRAHSFCWVKGSDVPRPVVTGQFGDKYVEITDGLNPGEEVYLAPPRPLAEDLIRQIDEAVSVPEEAAEAPGPAEAPQAEEAPQEGGAEAAADSEYMTEGALDWNKVRQQLEGLSEEERAQKLQAIIEKLPAEQREQMQARRRGGAGGQGGAPGGGAPGGGARRGGGRRGAGGGQETPSP